MNAELLFFFFLAALGFELSALHLPAVFALVILGMRSPIYAQAGLDHGPTIYNPLRAG
jgi:hypothetical protein